MSKSTISGSGILIPYQNIKFETILDDNKTVEKATVI